MLLDKDTNEILDASINSNIPNPGKGVVETKTVEGIEIRFLRSAEPLGFNSVFVLPYAVAALRDGKYICAAAIEREDLRALSGMLGVSLKSLQEDYGTKGYLLDPQVTIHGGGTSETLGRYTLSMDEETVKAYLYETILDVLDIVDE